MPTVLGVGVPGGFEDDSAADERTEYSIVVLPSDAEVPLDPEAPASTLPAKIVESALGVIRSDSAETKQVHVSI